MGDELDENFNDNVVKSMIVNGVNFSVDKELLFKLFSLCNRGKICTTAEFGKNDEREMCAIYHDTIMEELLEKYGAQLDLHISVRSK